MVRNTVGKGKLCGPEQEKKPRTFFRARKSIEEIAAMLGKSKGAICVF